jgi:hypothetical protein
MKESEDKLAFLLRVNIELADKEAKGQAAAPPGLPRLVSTPDDFITTDCIHVDKP